MFFGQKLCKIGVCCQNCGCTRRQIWFSACARRSFLLLWVLTKNQGGRESNLVPAAQQVQVPKPGKSQDRSAKGAGLQFTALPEIDVNQQVQKYASC